MKLSRTVTYALQATLQLAKADSSSPIPCSQIASQGNMPERFLLQVLRNLVAHGILRSTRGVDGGYALVRAPNDISMLDVIEAIDGPLSPQVPVKEGLPGDSQERLLDAIEQITATARQQLEAIKLAQLLEPPSAIPSSVGSLDLPTN